MFAAPPNSQGLALLLLLGMLDSAEGECDCNSREFPLRFIELKHLAFKLRDQIVGDPRVSRIPDKLLAPELLKDLAQSAKNHAFGLSANVQGLTRAGGGDTTCVVTMDEAGNAVSWLQSLFDEFGSGVVSESTGIVLHNRLHLASLKKGHANTGAKSPALSHALPCLGRGRRPMPFSYCDPGGPRSTTDPGSDHLQRLGKGNGHSASH